MKKNRKAIKLSSGNIYYRSKIVAIETEKKIFQKKGKKTFNEIFIEL